MADPSYLVTPCTFKGKEYLVNMKIQNRNVLDLKVTDKYTSEEWKCNYDALYIENLTHKTGNFKQFDIFIAMLKSSMLKTRDCVSLDLLTFEDLESLRSRHVTSPVYIPHFKNFVPAANSNRRYLILTYTVEFDRIHYPLPLEYSGLPDPHVLQATIRRLENELLRQQEERGTNQNGNKEHITQLENKILELTSKNKHLTKQLESTQLATSRKDSREWKCEIKKLQNAVAILEVRALQERAIFQKIIQELRQDKVQYLKQIARLEQVIKDLQTKLNHRMPTQVPFAGTRIGEDILESCRRSGDGSRNSARYRSPTKSLLRKRQSMPQPNTHRDNPPHLITSQRRSKSNSSFEKELRSNNIIRTSRIDMVGSTTPHKCVFNRNRSSSGSSKSSFASGMKEFMSLSKERITPSKRNSSISSKGSKGSVNARYFRETNQQKVGRSDLEKGIAKLQKLLGNDLSSLTKV